MCLSVYNIWHNKSLSISTQNLIQPIIVYQNMKSDTTNFLIIVYQYTRLDTTNPCLSVHKVWYNKSLSISTWSLMQQIIVYRYTEKCNITNHCLSVHGVQGVWYNIVYQCTMFNTTNHCLCTGMWKQVIVYQYIKLGAIHNCLIVYQHTLLNVTINCLSVHELNQKHVVTVKPVWRVGLKLTI